jgi:hypothetical protein
MATSLWGIKAARAGPVPFLPRQHTGTAYECLILIGQNRIVWAAPCMFLSQVPIWVTFCSRRARNVGPCQRTWHETRVCTRPHLCQYCEHNVPIDWGLMVRAVDSAKGVTTRVWQGGSEPLQGVASGCCPHTLLSANRKSTCRDEGCSAH